VKVSYRLNLGVYTYANGEKQEWLDEPGMNFRVNFIEVVEHASKPKSTLKSSEGSIKYSSGDEYFGEQKNNKKEGRGKLLLVKK
jgi:hypothetical protein